ncbi:GNAT family N-acetyltransferase [Streptomyces sp. NBC_01724]|uniref:GNAT family N-acetyltransferase n=1 Tax=Streptomyces sp. NBC_01724 TaxID=2975922 RepID=UPI003FCD06DE
MDLDQSADRSASAVVRSAALNEADLISEILSSARDDQEVQGLPVSWRVIPRAAVSASVIRGDAYLVQLVQDAVGTFSLEWQDTDVWPELDNVRAAYLHRLALCPRHHGQGIGSFAVDWAKQAAAERGCSHLRLDAVSANTRLCQWYERLGFVPRGEVLLPGWTRSSKRYELSVTDALV